MDNNSDKQDIAGTQLYHELHRVIERYGKESDITIFQTIGTLEAIKWDLLENKNEFQDNEGEDKTSVD